LIAASTAMLDSATLAIVLARSSSMSVELTTTVQTFLSQAILSSKFGFVLAVPAFATIVIFQTSCAFTAEDTISNTFPSFATSIATLACQSTIGDMPI
jgi:hypothetical protein